MCDWSQRGGRRMVEALRKKKKLLLGRGKNADGSGELLWQRDGKLVPENRGGGIENAEGRLERILEPYAPYGSACSMWYCFSLRYKVVFPMPSMRAAESLSPPVSRRVRRMACRSNSSRGRISSFSGALSVEGQCRLDGRSATWRIGPDPRATPRSMAFSSPRPLP